MWEEIGAGVWLDPGVVTRKETLAVDYNTQFGPGYGDTLSWHAAYAPGLGEQSATVVEAVDARRMEDLIVRLLEAGARRR